MSATSCINHAFAIAHHMGYDGLHNMANDRIGHGRELLVLGLIVAQEEGTAIGQLMQGCGPRVPSQKYAEVETHTGLLLWRTDRVFRMHYDHMVRFIKERQFKQRYGRNNTAAEADEAARREREIGEEAQGIVRLDGGERERPAVDHEVPRGPRDRTPHPVTALGNAQCLANEKGTRSTPNNT